MKREILRWTGRVVGNVALLEKTLIGEDGSRVTERDRVNVTSYTPDGRPIVGVGFATYRVLDNSGNVITRSDNH
jgi:hypothetical protein